MRLGKRGEREEKERVRSKQANEKKKFDRETKSSEIVQPIKFLMVVYEIWGSIPAYTKN